MGGAKPPPTAVDGDPTVATPEQREFFEPQLRSKEWIERRTDVKVACAAFVAYHMGIVAWILASSGSTAALLYKIMLLFVALYGSDLFTGFLHIYLDHRRCDVGDPLDVVAYSFRYDHHARPTNFMKDSAFFPAGMGEIIARLALPVSLIVHTVLWYSGGVATDGPGEQKLLMSCIWICTGTLCQTCHALAHEGIGNKNKSFPRTVAFLQRSGCILPPKVHGNHHRGAHDQNFCILNGWANPLLNALSPAVFWGMRQLPGHFDPCAVPGRK